MVFANMTEVIVYNSPADYYIYNMSADEFGAVIMLICQIVTGLVSVIILLDMFQSFSQGRKDWWKFWSRLF